MHESVSFIHSQGPDKSARRIFDLISSMLEVMNQRSVVNKYGHDWASLARPGYEIVHLFFLGFARALLNLSKRRIPPHPMADKTDEKEWRDESLINEPQRVNFLFLSCAITERF